VLITETENHVPGIAEHKRFAGESDGGRKSSGGGG
jgi:hypothetical protein